MRRTYEEIVDKDVPTSERHPRMPISARAAQFAPFAALVGFDERVREAGRLTVERAELTEDKAEEINSAILHLLSNAPCRAKILYYLPDKLKSGGAYVTFDGDVLRYSETDHSILCRGGARIPINDIFDIWSVEDESEK